MGVLRRLGSVDAALLDREIDELLLQARGLVLVRALLADRGASRDELDAHERELHRVRARLAERIREPAALEAAA